MMDIEKLIESAEHCDLGDCANCPSCGRVCCKERTMGELAREVKRLQAENEKLRDELERVKRERDAAIEAANGLDKMIGRAWGGRLTWNG